MESNTASFRYTVDEMLAFVPKHPTIQNLELSGHVDPDSFREVYFREDGWEGVHDLQSPALLERLSEAEIQLLKNPIVEGRKPVVRLHIDKPTRYTWTKPRGHKNRGFPHERRDDVPDPNHRELEPFVFDLQDHAGDLDPKLTKTMPRASHFDALLKLPSLPVYGEWMYKDLEGKIQGPFSSEQMRQWSFTGYFSDPTIPVKPFCGSSEPPVEFLTLEKWIALYGRAPWSFTCLDTSASEAKESPSCIDSAIVEIKKEANEQESLEANSSNEPAEPRPVSPNPQSSKSDDDGFRVVAKSKPKKRPPQQQSPPVRKIVGL